MAGGSPFHLSVREAGIWLADPDGTHAIPIAPMGNSATGYPKWSPSGESIVFHSNRGGQPDIYLVPSTGGKPLNLTSDPSTDAFPSFSRDGKWIYFTSDRNRTTRFGNCLHRAVNQRR